MERRYSCGVLVAWVMVAGCGGGSSTGPLAATSTSLPNGTVSTPYTANLSATGGTPPYTWSQTSGGAMPGGVTLSSTGTFTGTPTTAGTFGPYVFMVTDSASNTASTASLSITITSSTLAVGTNSLPSGAVGTAYSTTLSATGGSSPYAWAQTSGGAMPPGIANVTSGGVIAGTPTTAGTYGPYVFTVTDTKGTTAASASLTITIAASTVAQCPSQGNEAALTSANPYAFLVKGTDGRGNPIDIAGSFTPNGSGGLANAVVDYNGFTNGPAQLAVNLSASSYAFGSSGQGCLYLSFSGLATASAVKKAEESRPGARENTVGRGRKSVTPEIAATFVSSVLFSFNLSGFDGTVYHTGRIIEADNTTSGTNASGFVHVQDTSAFSLASLLPTYTLGVDGWTINPSGGILRTVLASSVSNSSGSLFAGFADVNVAGKLSGEVTGGHGGIASSIDANSGRGTGSYFLITPSGNFIFDFAFYILNTSDLILISTDSPGSSPSSPLLAGRAMQSGAAFNGYYLLASQGLETSGASIGNLASIGTLSATSAGTIPALTIYSNDAGSYSVNQYTNGSYTVESSSGRMAISGLNSTPPVVYLTVPGSDDGIAGFLVGTDPQASSGVLVNQSSGAPNYTVASVTGNYASSTEEDVDGRNGAYLGAFTFNGAGAYTVVSQTTGSVPNTPSQKTISINTDGSGNLDGGNFPLVTNGQVIYAIPDSGDPLLFVFMAGALP